MYLAIIRVVAMNQKPPEQQQLTLGQTALHYAGINPDWCDGDVGKALDMELDNAERAAGYLEQLKAMVRRGELKPCRREKTRIKNPGFFDVLMADDREPYYTDPDKDTLYLDEATIEKIRADVISRHSVRESEADLLLHHFHLKFIKTHCGGKYAEHGAQNAVAKDIESMAKNDLLSSTGLSAAMINKRYKAGRETLMGRKK